MDLFCWWLDNPSYSSTVSLADLAQRAPTNILRSIVRGQLMMMIMLVMVTLLLGAIVLIGMKYEL